MKNKIGCVRLPEMMLFAGQWIGTRFSKGSAANHT